MPTPTYIPFDPAALVPGDDGDDIPVDAQNNDNALADEAALNGMLGWDETTTYSGTTITREVAIRGNDGVRIDYTYVPSGPATGLCATETHYWSNDGGATWTLRTDSANGVTAGVLTYSYNGFGQCTGATWS